jgi:hypothetical protein
VAAFWPGKEMGPARVPTAFAASMASWPHHRLVLTRTAPSTRRGAKSIAEWTEFVLRNCEPAMTWYPAHSTTTASARLATGLEERPHRWAQV